jgi:cAMP-dependent protein kinase regulator
MGSVEQDLQKYLAEHNVEDLLKDIVVKLCLEKPDDPLEFVKKYVSELQHKDAEEDDEEPLPRGPGRRGAVSASVMTEEEIANYEKKVRLSWPERVRTIHSRT